MIDIDSSKLVQRIEQLKGALKLSRNFETSSFFDRLAERVVGSRDLNHLKMVLEEIEKLGAIAQYAGFSDQEESLLQQVQDEASSLKQLLG